MVKLDLKVFPSGPLDTNNYLLFDQQSKKGCIIDLSSSSGRLFDFLKREGIKVDFVLLTHAHFDHIEGLRHTDFPFFLHKKDFALISDPEKNGSAFFSDPIVIEKKPYFYKEKLDFCGLRIDVIHTPGHTPGSVSLKLDNWLFSGDTIFYQAVGRTDIPLASGQELNKSIKEKILVLPDETIIYPGHGLSSTLAHEKKHNPFLAI
ncbi:MAG: MBL fold metallo-hydrolase [Candidatus Omnitrophica bacterium]|nr:MBL fold metallo-hydrolase [Candidatus Omnitrophota bacterium]MCF7893574.1 MBL fold metallo-hydrolase [Candidatus Omnitrophota bacterium]